MAASLLLIISATIGLAGGSQENPELDALLAHGWVWSDRLDCGALRPGTFYEVGNEKSSAEVFFLDLRKQLVSQLPLPEMPYQCREIKKPHFIEEIL